jgi:hypothetical protein
LEGSCLARHDPSSCLYSANVLEGFFCEIRLQLRAGRLLEGSERLRLWTRQSQVLITRPKDAGLVCGNAHNGLRIHQITNGVALRFRVLVCGDNAVRVEVTMF